MRIIRFLLHCKITNLLLRDGYKTDNKLLHFYLYSFFDTNFPFSSHIYQVPDFLPVV